MTFKQRNGDKKSYEGKGNLVKKELLDIKGNNNADLLYPRAVCGKCVIQNSRWGKGVNKTLRHSNPTNNIDNLSYRDLRAIDGYHVNTVTQEDKNSVCSEQHGYPSLRAVDGKGPTLRDGTINQVSSYEIGVNRIHIQKNNIKNPRAVNGSHVEAREKHETVKRSGIARQKCVRVLDSSR